MRLPFYTTLLSSSVLFRAQKRNFNTTIAFATPAFFASLLFWSTDTTWALIIDQICLTVLLLYSFVRALFGLNLKHWIIVSSVLITGALFWAYKKEHELQLGQSEADMLHAGFHMFFIAGFHLMIMWLH